jgi:hypothetical protein
VFECGNQVEVIEVFPELQVLALEIA